jgi:hypothetical protein
MTVSGKPVSLGFERIRQDLDPAYSYMVFETVAGPGQVRVFREVLKTLVSLTLTVHDHQMFHDDIRGRLLLVVKFDPSPPDAIMQEFLALGLPADITCYAYGSQGAG